VICSEQDNCEEFYADFRGIYSYLFGPLSSWSSTSGGEIFRGVFVGLSFTNPGAKKPNLNGDKNLVKNNYFLLQYQII